MNLVLIRVRPIRSSRNQLIHNFRLSAHVYFKSQEMHGQ